MGHRSRRSLSLHPEIPFYTIDTYCRRLSVPGIQEPMTPSVPCSLEGHGLELTTLMTCSSRRPGESLRRSAITSGLPI